MVDKEKGDLTTLHLKMAELLIEKNKDTNFREILRHHLKVVLEYMVKARQGISGRQAFSNREAYQTFCVSSFFYLNLRHQIFEKNNAFTKEDVYKGPYLPPLEAFHCSEDQREMEKNRSMAMIKSGDILNLKIVKESEKEFELQILNKHGDERRFVENQLFTKLSKDNQFVSQTFPPFKESDYVRAAVSSKCKREEGLLKNVLVSLNPNFVKDDKFKSLPLGRISKDDILFFPEDISGYRNFGMYLDDHNVFENPSEVHRHISAFQCDPLQTFGYFNLKLKRRSDEEDLSTLSEEQKLSILREKLEKANENLDKGDLKNALLEVEQALETCPKSDMALIIRGKIYLAMAGGKPSSKVAKAFTDFEKALKIDPLNKEAATFFDFIAMESVTRLFQQNMKLEAKTLKQHLKSPKDTDEGAAAFMESVKNGTVERKRLNIEADIVGVATVKEEPMEV